MAINADRILAVQIPTVEQRYDWKYCVRYALGLGVGLDPRDETELAFVDESRLRVEPTLVNVLGNPGFWERDMKELGFDWVQIVHGEQSMRIHRPLRSEGLVTGKTRVVDLVDRGTGNGALLYIERNVSDATTGEVVATVNETVFCRGDGGFGGKTERSKSRGVPHAIPSRDPDLSIDLPTSPQSALIYRLSGDDNPLHIDPTTARAAGFARPILHGLATFGAAGHGLVKRLCDGDPAGLRAMSARFSSPVYPGETIRLEIWRDGNRNASFKASIAAREVVVLSKGYAELGV